MTNLITEARELCESATPGPWTVSGSKGQIIDSVLSLNEYDMKSIVCDIWRDVEGNAAFISRSRTLIPELCDALEKAQFDADMNNRRWIPVTERLPNNKQDDWVLAQITESNGYMWIPKVVEYREVKNDWYCEELGWLKDHKGLFAVTHWMPLPAPPEEGAEK